MVIIILIINYIKHDAFNHLRKENVLKFKYNSTNLNLDHRLMGFEMLHSPFVDKISLIRGDMFAKHLSQSMVIHGSEFPYVFSGYEYRLGQHIQDPSKREEDVEVIAVIPKYLFVSSYHTTENPELTVIYKGIDSKKIGYFTVPKFTKGTDKFGYYNKLMNQHMLTPGSLLPQDVKLLESPINKDGKYELGLNLKVANITMPETVEDAILIDESTAKKMATTSIKTVSILVVTSQHPLYLYADDAGENKFLPDIGEQVREDGILAGFRQPTDTTFISDLSPDELTVPQYMHDRLYRAEPGAIVLDIDVHMNRAKGKVPKQIWSQVEKYHTAGLNYCKKIVDLYKQYREYQITPEMNTLVTKCMSKLMAAGIKVKGVPYKSTVNLSNKDAPIEYMQIDVTYAYTLQVGPGFKVTDRNGHKGVISAIWPDENMPVDAYGIRANMVLHPLAGFNRMNGGQWYEQELNRCSYFVRNELAQNKSFAYVLEYLRDINEVYAEIVEETYTTEADQMKFVETCLNEGIYVHIPVSYKGITLEKMKFLNRKYAMPITTTVFKKENREGVLRDVETTCKVCIGEKYTYLLCKIPEMTASGFGFINQFQTPIAPNKIGKMTFPISRTTVRFGEDERRIAISTSPVSSVVRLNGIQANSMYGVNKLIKSILTASNPAKMGKVDVTNQELIRNDTIIGIAHHCFKTFGVDSYNTKVDNIDDILNGLDMIEEDE